MFRERERERERSGMQRDKPWGHQLVAGVLELLFGWLDGTVREEVRDRPKVENLIGNSYINLGLIGLCP